MIKAEYKRRTQYKQRAKWTSKNRFCCPFGLEKCLWTIFKAIWLCAFLLKFCLYSLCFIILVMEHENLRFWRYFTKPPKSLTEPSGLPRALGPQGLPKGLPSKINIPGFPLYSPHGRFWEKFCFES